MKQTYFSLFLCGCAAVSALAAPVIPVALAYSDYTGDSFVANWQGKAGSNYLLNVFAPSATDTTVTEDFSAVNQANGKINQTTPNYPAGWEVAVTDNGSTDVVYYNNKNHILLDATGDAVTTPFFLGGNLKSYVLNANVVNADGITKDNSSVFKVQVYNKDGELITSGQIETLYFAQRTDFDLVEAFGYTPGNVGKILITLIKDDGKVGDLAINSITYKYEAPDYVLRNYATTAESHKVTGLDADKAYYYYLQAKDDTTVSDISNIIFVDGFLTPVATDAVDITGTSFTATWNRLPKAAGYILHPYKYEIATEPGTKTILADDFSKATSGTVASPVTISNPDDVTATPGWIGRNFITAEGMFGANAGRFPMNLSYVQTPVLNLAANNGNYTVKIKAYGTAGDYLSLYRVGYLVNNALNIHKVTFDDNGVAEETWQMTDGAEEMRISIEESKLKKYLIDEISITQVLNVGDTTKISLATDTIVGGENTSFTFTNLEENGKYGYAVEGYRHDFYGYPEYTELSNVINVDLKANTGVNGIDADASAPVVRQAGREVSVALQKAEPIYIYGLDGRFVQTVAGRAGVNSFTLNAASAYVLKVGAYSYKLIVK